MNQDVTRSPSALRKLAEERFRMTSPESPQPESADLQRLVHELQVHQIELEMQNEELTRLSGTLTEALEAEQKAKEAMMTAWEQAYNSNRAKDQFLANMSHEIRTPLHGLVGLLQLLEMNNPTPEQSEYIRAALSSSDSLMRVINDVLDYSKIEAGMLTLEKHPFCLKSLSDELITLFQPSVLSRHLELTLTIDEDVPKILSGDSFRLRQVLSNLIGNAVKFTTRGSVEVRVRKLEDLHGSAKLEWSIRDTGIGMSPESQKSIFNSFFQADGSTTRRFGGSGLGLSICRSLVELMQGEIRVDSTIDKGSCFTFTGVFGVCDIAFPQLSNKPPVGIVPSQDLKLLIVEDDVVSQTVMGNIIRQKGWQPTIAENCTEALDALRRQVFDVVLMDIRLPGQDGYEITESIRKLESTIGRRTPIIAVTAYAMAGDRDKCLHAGMDDYLPKPLTVDHFYATVEKWAYRKP